MGKVMNKMVIVFVLGGCVMFGVVLVGDVVVG